LKWHLTSSCGCPGACTKQAWQMSNCSRILCCPARVESPRLEPLSF
jgi:hypothetical protein